MIGLFAFSSLLGFAQKYNYASYADYPAPSDSLTEMKYTTGATDFQLWAPTAQKVELKLYTAGQGGKCVKTIGMKRTSDGTWHTTVKGNLDGHFYTFNAKVNGKWMGENPGINAHAGLLVKVLLC